MAKALGQNVYVDGVLYEAGSTPPKEIADRIENPKAWEADEADAPADDDAKAPAKKSASSKSSK